MTLSAGTFGGPTAAGNVLTNDRDVDNGDTKTVIAVNGSQANVGQLLIGIYGTLTLLADGSWNYTLDPSDPDVIALPPDQTAVDSFTYTMRDTLGATSSTTLDITVSGGVSLPYINTISTHDFATPSEPGDIVFINGFSWQDADSVGDVTVRISSLFLSDVLHATSGGGVTVTGAGDHDLTLTGTIADINAYISGNNVRWDPPAGDFDRHFTFTIDDNGAALGGAIVSVGVEFNHRSININSFGGDNINLAGWNVSHTNLFLGDGNDTIVTAWSHGPFSNDIQYDGGDGFDTITMVFTPAQLEAILSNSFDRGALQNYLDGDVSGPFGDDFLFLGGTSWNATVFNFERCFAGAGDRPQWIRQVQRHRRQPSRFRRHPGLLEWHDRGHDGRRHHFRSRRQRHPGRPQRGRYVERRYRVRHAARRIGQRHA